MVSREDVESFLIRTELDFEEVEEALWLVRTPASEDTRETPTVFVNFAPPVVLLRSGVRRVPESDDACLRLFRRLLELNASDLVHGAYGLEDGEVILTDTLELEDLDFSEFRASLESISMAVTSHLQQLTRD